jgi:hypothetical protein
VDGHVLRLHQRVERLGGVELAEAGLPAELSHVLLTVYRRIHGLELGRRRPTVVELQRDVLDRRDFLAEIAQFVHARHAVHEQRIGAHGVSRNEPSLVEAVQEEERAIAHGHRRKHDLFESDARCKSRSRRV